MFESASDGGEGSSQASVVSAHAGFGSDHDLDDTEVNNSRADSEFGGEDLADASVDGDDVHMASPRSANLRAALESLD